MAADVSNNVEQQSYKFFGAGGGVDDPVQFAADVADDGTNVDNANADADQVEYIEVVIDGTTRYIPVYASA